MHEYINPLECLCQLQFVLVYIMQILNIFNVLLLQSLPVKYKKQSHPSISIFLKLKYPIELFGGLFAVPRSEVLSI